MIKYPIHYSDFLILEYSPQLANKYANQIIEALNQIPLVEKHTKDQLLSETKGDRILYSKWKHSLIALDNDNEFGGVIVGYERSNEGNKQYPHNSIYLNDLAVAEKHQHKGLGKFLVKTWLDHNAQIGFIDLVGPVKFSVQTNSAFWNKHVQDLYTLFGFKKIATKTYENRIDNVYLHENS